METENKSLVLTCSSCRNEFPHGTEQCPDHGQSLELLEDKLIGTTIGEHYEIVERVGKGGMGVVYKAHHKYMETFVAVKILYKEYSSNQAAINRFKQEARMLASLKHPNILRVTDFGMTAENEPYLVMEFLEGTTLEGWLDKHGRMPIERALNLFTQACDALTHAHGKGVIHRDLKPGNLMLIKEPGAKEQVKLLDFGIAKVKGSLPQNLTQSGEIYGSPLYMSPEQCQGKTLDERSDIYSFGCVIYETLTGMPPLMGANSFETMTKHVQERPLPLRGAAPEAVIPELIDVAVTRALEKQPEKRQKSALELKNQLVDAAVQSSIYFLEEENLYVPKPFETGQLHAVPGVLPTPKDLSPGKKQSSETKEQSSSDLDRHELERLVQEAQTFTLQTQARAGRMRALLLIFGTTLIVAIISGTTLLVAPGPERDPSPNWQKEWWRIEMTTGDKAAAQADRDRSDRSIQGKEFASAEKAYLQAIDLGKQMGPIYDKAVKAEQALMQLYEAKGDEVAAERMREQLFNDHLRRELFLYGASGADDRAVPDLDNALLTKGAVDAKKLDPAFADKYSHKLIDSARDSFRLSRYTAALRYLEEAVSLEERAHRSSSEVSQCANEFASGLSSSQSDRRHIEQIESLLKRAQSAQN